MWAVQWSKSAQKQFAKLPEECKKIIMEKGRQVADSPYDYLERLSNSPRYKYRVGIYRVIVEIDNGNLFIHKVKKRSRVYD